MNKPNLLTLTTADRLRSDLSDIDSIIGKIDLDNPQKMIKVFDLMDEIYLLLPEIKANGTDIRAELSHLETLESQLISKSEKAVKKITKSGDLEKAREGKDIPEKNWWWYLDEGYAHQKQKTLHRYLRISAIVLVLFAIAIIVYKNFLAPDPALSAKLSHQYDAQEFIMTGDYNDALNEVQKALTYMPTDGDLLVFQGVVQEAMGQEQNAQISYEQASAVMDEKAFLISRIQYNMYTEDQEAILQDVTTLNIKYPDYSLGYYYQGMYYENINERGLAMEAYEKADELAKSHPDEYEISAMARLKLAELYSILDYFPVPTEPVQE